MEAVVALTPPSPSFALPAATGGDAAASAVVAAAVDEAAGVDVAAASDLGTAVHCLPFSVVRKAPSGRSWSDIVVVERKTRERTHAVSSLLVSFSYERTPCLCDSSRKNNECTRSEAVARCPALTRPKAPSTKRKEKRKQGHRCLTRNRSRGSKLREGCLVRVANEREVGPESEGEETKTQPRDKWA